jgi:hypothetical protein
VKVLLLGAGASKAAGYPLCGELLTEVEKDAATSPLSDVKEAWGRWSKYKSSLPPGPLKTLLDAPNPEIALSALGLFPQAYEDHTRKFLYAARGPNLTDEDQAALLSEWKAVVDDPEIRDAGLALQGLVDCLWHYFCWRAYGETENRSRREPLRRVLARLEEGDKVITFNWDVTVEWTLAEDGRWTPVDGYGFPMDLRTWTYPERPRLELRPSDVTVLKVHGGAGWRVANPEAKIVSLDNAYLLNFLRVIVDGVDVHFQNEAHRVHLPPDDEYGFIIPTFLKTVPDGPAMQTVWYLADEALRRADLIETYGYSLPASDSAARVLLNRLRFRLDAGDVRVRVHAGKGDAQDRWRAFLGPKAEIDDEKIE